MSFLKTKESRFPRLQSFIRRICKFFVAGLVLAAVTGCEERLVTKSYSPERITIVNTVPQNWTVCTFEECFYVFNYSKEFGRFLVGETYLVVVKAYNDPRYLREIKSILPGDLDITKGTLLCDNDGNCNFLKTEKD